MDKEILLYYIVLGILPFIFVIFLLKATEKNSKLNKFLIRNFHKTMRNVWDDTFDLKNGSNLKIFLKDKDYYIHGSFRRYGNGWIVLEDFAKRNTKDNMICDNALDFTGGEMKASIMIPFSEINNIEVF